MSDDNSCKEGYKVCGNVAGKSKGVCIPDSETCPITKIVFSSSNPDPLVYDLSKVGTGVSAFYTRKNLADPWVDTEMSESHRCYDIGAISITPNRKKYVLIRNSPDSDCKQDSRYTKHDILTYGRKELFDINNVDYKNLPAFTISNTQKYHKFTRNLIEWAPKCRSIVPNMVSQEKNIKKLENSTKLVKAFSLVSLIFCVINSLSHIFGLNKEYHIWGVIFICGVPTTILWVLHAIFLLVLMGRANDLTGVYSKIGEFDCSDDFTDNGFKGFDDELELHCRKRALVSLIVVLLIILYNLIVQTYYHCQWLMTCSWATKLTEWKREQEQTALRLKTALTAKNKVMGHYSAPSIKTRKEMTKQVGGYFNKVIQSPAHQQFSQRDSMMPVLGKYNNFTMPPPYHPPTMLNPPKQQPSIIVQPVIQPVIFQQVIPTPVPIVVSPTPQSVVQAQQKSGKLDSHKESSKHQSNAESWQLDFEKFNSKEEEVSLMKK